MGRGELAEEALRPQVDVVVPDLGVHAPHPIAGVGAGGVVKRIGGEGFFCDACRLVCVTKTALGNKECRAGKGVIVAVIKRLERIALCGASIAFFEGEQELFFHI